MRAFPLMLLCALAVTACSDSIALEEYDRELQDAKPCAQGDTCVVFNPNVPCLCPTIINAKSVDHMRDRAGKVDCAGATATCAETLQNPRCIEAVCMGDPGDAGADADAATDAASDATADSSAD